MGFKRKAVVLATSLALVGGGAAAMVATSAPAFAANDDDVTCAYPGTNGTTVEGVWVAVSGGTSGWATLNSDGVGGTWVGYPAIEQGYSYSLHIGCGGSPSNWAYTPDTPVVSGYTDWVCSPSYVTVGGCTES